MNNKRIKHLKESPCYKCGKEKQCSEKIQNNPKLVEIVDYVFGRAEFDYSNCSLFNVIRLEEGVR